MTYEISPDRKILVLIADLDEQAELQVLRLESPEEWGTEEAELTALESLLANSKLEWVSGDTDDLTEAPMLGLVGEPSREPPKSHHGIFLTSWDEHLMFFAPILERWAFMDYQLRSFLEDLADEGKAVFVS